MLREHCASLKAISAMGNMAPHKKRCGCTLKLGGVSTLGIFSNAHTWEILGAFHIKKLGAQCSMRPQLPCFNLKLFF